MDIILRLWCALGFHDVWSGQRMACPCTCPSIWERLLRLA